MNIFQAIIIGIIQGLTEFFPVSSTGHLVVLEHFWGIRGSLAFDVFVHAGSFLAILIYFRKEIFNILSSFFEILKRPKIETPSQKMIILLLLGSLPAGVLGFFLADIIENYLRDIRLVAFNLIFFGLILYWVDKKIKHTKTIEKLSFGQALGIGCFQALALMPGVSRSGITIMGGLLFGLKKDEAVEFSFLLSLPTIFGAILKEALNFRGEILTMGTLEVFLLFLSSFLASLFAISFLLNFVKKHSFNFFVVWRVVLGILILGFLRT